MFRLPPRSLRPHDLGERPPNRRVFLEAATAAAAGLALPGGAAAQERSEPIFSCCTGNDPIGCIRRTKFDVLAAFVEAQLVALWSGPPGDSPAAVADDVLRYATALPQELQRGLCGALTYINLYSLRTSRKAFVRLTPWERTALLNQGEYPGPTDFPRICWDDEYILHTAVGSLAMLCRLVTNARPPARMWVGLTWSAPCRDPRRLVQVSPPPYPDLNATYDVCVIGSGAGGAVMAARASEAGQRVLVIESGKWVSPDALVERYVNDQGQVEIFPPRCDRVLSELYRDGGANIAGGLRDVLDSRWDVILPWRRSQIQPQQSISVLQAHVVGGGPYINNAIHLEMREDAWNAWGERQPAGVSYQDLRLRMEEIKHDLGVTRETSRRNAGARSWKFVDGCLRAGEHATPVPVSILPDCGGCGADNSTDPFGHHTGGLHPWRNGRPNSYLMRALQAPLPAQIAYEARAVALKLAAAPEGSSSGDVVVAQVVLEDRRGAAPHGCGLRRTVAARKFVLAAGPVQSTNLLRRTLCCAGLRAPELGERLTGNVGTPVYAVFDKPIIPCEQQGLPEPGVAQCFLVDRKLAVVDGRVVVVEPDLENWFHFPGTVAVALTGWFQEYARVMRKYNHLSISGLFVPTKVRPENCVRPDESIHLELDAEEFELLLRGMERIGRIYLAAATPDNGVTLYLPTKALLLDRCCRPLAIRTYGQLRWALAEIRQRGPAFVNLLTSHPQGGNPLGGVVDPWSFRVNLCDGRQVQNLYVADASIFPAGCEMNPQLTVKALAHFAADRLLSAA